jgi:hypothetical protein
MAEGTGPVGRWDRVLRGYAAALGAMSFILPSSGALLICVAYLAPWDADRLWLRTNAVMIGVAGAGVLWLLLAWPLSSLAAIRADTRSYSELAERVAALDIKLGHQRLEDLQLRKAFAEARAHVDFVLSELAGMRQQEGSLRDVRGVPASAYVALRTRLHRAEEALFLLEPAPEVIALALFDRFRLQDSHIGNKSDMLAQLEAAVAVLREDPAALSPPS